MYCVRGCPLLNYQMISKPNVSNSALTPMPPKKPPATAPTPPPPFPSPSHLVVMYTSTMEKLKA